MQKEKLFNLGKYGRIYHFEQNKAAQSFQERMQRNHKKQTAKAFLINQNLDNYKNHKKIYMPRDLSHKIDRTPFSEEKFQHMALLARTRASMGRAHSGMGLIMSHESPQRFVPQGYNFKLSPETNNLIVTKQQIQQIERILLKLLFDVEAVVTNVYN